MMNNVFYKLPEEKNQTRSPLFLTNPMIKKLPVQKGTNLTEEGRWYTM
jgi:hypothetical protein